MQLKIIVSIEDHTEPLKEENLNEGASTSDGYRLLPAFQVTEYRIGSSIPFLHDFEISSIHHTVDQYIRGSHMLLLTSLPLTFKSRRL